MMIMGLMRCPDYQLIVRVYDCDVVVAGSRASIVRGFCMVL